MRMNAWAGTVRRGDSGMPFNCTTITRLLAAALLVPHGSGLLAGKRVLVTGASGGLGAAIAKKLGSLDARVIVHYNTRHEGALATAAAIGGACDGIVQCDFRDRDAIDAMWADVDAIWPDRALDVLVNNAGVVAKVAARPSHVWTEPRVVALRPLSLTLCRAPPGQVDARERLPVERTVPL